MTPDPRTSTTSHRLPAALAAVLALALGISRPCRAQEGDARWSAGLMYTGEVASVLEGGDRTGTTYLGNLDLTAWMGLEEVTGWHGASVFLYLLGNHGGSPSSYAGDLQTVSNIQAPEGLSLYEVWVETRFAGDHLSLLAGLYDLNTEFDVLQTASLFLNSSHGIGAEFGQSGANGPSIFPVTSPGLRLRAVPDPHLYIQAAVLDGVPGPPGGGRTASIHLSGREGMLLAAEMGMTHVPGDQDPVPVGAHHRARHERVGREGGGPHQTKFAVGGWVYTEPAEPIAPGTTGSTAQDRGVYVLAESMLGPHRNDPHRGLSAFLRAGVAEPEVNIFSSYIGAGIVYSGPFTREDRDQLGLAAARAHTGAPWVRSVRSAGGEPAAAETSLEVTYSCELSSLIVVQGDIQYVLDPGASGTRPDALVTLLRVRLIL